MIESVVTYSIIILLFLCVFTAREIRELISFISQPWFYKIIKGKGEPALIPRQVHLCFKTYDLFALLVLPLSCIHIFPVTIHHKVKRGTCFMCYGHCLKIIIFSAERFYFVSFFPPTFVQKQLPKNIGLRCCGNI